LVDHERIDGVMVSMLASSVVDRVFEPQPSKTKDYAIGTSCISNKHAGLSSKRKYWLAQDQDNVSEWSDIPMRDCYFSEPSLKKRTKRVDIV
jgi:hypothetical protein